MSHSPAKSQYYNVDNNRQHSRYENGNGVSNGHHQNNRYQNSNTDVVDSSNYHQHRDVVPRSTYADRTYSLPRQQHQSSSQHNGYYTQDRRSRNPRHHQQQQQQPSSHHHQHYNNQNSGSYDVTNAAIDKPDFYFMPSQRKYSGEVVRVYVDYNKDMKSN